MVTRFAHVTDLHLKDLGHRIPLKQGHELVNAVNEEDVDVIVNTGDDVGSGFACQFRAVKPVTRRFTERNRDAHGSPGNHDTTWAGASWGRYNRSNWEQYAEDIYSAYVAGSKWPQVHDYSDVRLILGDTTTSPTAVARGVLGSEQIDDIVDAVERGQQRKQRTVVAFHHCMSGQNTLGLKDRHELRDKLRARGGADLLISGHLHHAHEWSYVMGFRRIHASPMSVERRRFRVFWWDEEGLFHTKWVHF